MHRILSIDPSGTGTSRVYFKDGDREIFISHQDQEGKKHWQFIYGLVKQWHPDILLFENTNFIRLRGKDSSLLRLLGAMEILSLPCSTLPKIKTIPVNQVKELRSKLLKGNQKIEGLEYRKGQGGHCHQKKISVHVLDAYLIYGLGKEKEQEKPRLKGLGEIKVERGYKDYD